MKINETEEKTKSLLKSETSISEISVIQLEKRKNLLWEIIRAKFTNGDPWAVAELCEIQYILGRKEAEREQSRLDNEGKKTKQSINDTPNPEWELLKRKQSKP